MANMANMANIFKSHASRYQTMLSNFMTNEDDGDTEDDSYHCRVLRAYYTKEERPFPSWLPPDPRAPARPLPTPMVSSSTFQSSLRASPFTRTSTENSLARTQSNQSAYSNAPSMRPGITSTWESRGPPPSTRTASALTSQSDKLRAKFGGNRSSSPQNSYTGTSSNPPTSISTSNPYESSLRDRAGPGSRAGSSFTGSPHVGREPAPPPTMTRSYAPWDDSGSGDQYNGFSSYGGSTPYGSNPYGGSGGRSGGGGSGGGRPGLPTGPSSGLHRGPKGR